MSDIELVIKISEKDYQTILNHGEEILDESSFIEPKYLYRAVLNGTPLPKGHGRLIDMKNLQNFVSKYTEYDAIQLILVDREDYIPTIIEADKESGGII